MSSKNAVPLRTGDARLVPIFARKWHNRTNILLEEGGTYDLVASGTWRDASIPSGPAGQDTNALLQKLTWLKRWRAQKWFALIGVVAGRRFLIGSHARITAETTGELVCWANDSWFFYWNNKEKVDLQITRLS